MSKRISEISNEYRTKAEDARRTINDAQRLPISYFAGVTEVAQGHFNEKKEWVRENPKYQYSGWGVRDTYAEANNDRNADIDSKIGILNSKIGFCNSRKGELNAVKADCEESLSNLNADIATLQKAQSSFQSIAANMTSAMRGYGASIYSLDNTYNCLPSNLNNGTSRAINTTTKGFSSGSISQGISSLEGYVQTGESIMSSITSLESQLAEKIADLEAQRSEFEGMKQ